MDMNWTMALTIIGSILIPMLGGFGFLISWLSSIDRRISHLEGAFEERGRWESKHNGTEGKK
jgi:hypothetical protein